MSVRKYKGVQWRSRIFSGGKQIASQVFDLKRDADAWDTEQNRALLAGQWIDPRAGSESLGDAIAEYLSDLEAGNPHTYDTVEANMRLHVSARLKRMPIRAVTSGDFDTMYANLLKKPKSLSRGTVSRVRDGLSSFYGWAQGKGMVRENVIIASKVPKGAARTESESIRPFTDDGFAKMLELQCELNADYAKVVEFAVLTGMRWGEIVALRVRDIMTSPFPSVMVSRSASDGYAVKSTKSNKPRRVPLLGRAEDIALAFAAGKQPDDYVFTAPRGGRMSGNNLKRSLRWTETAAGHKFHDLRHTAATNWLMSGIDVKTVSKWLGHANAAITLRIYVHWMGDAGDIAAISILEERANANATEPASDLTPIAAVSVSVFGLEPTPELHPEVL